MTTYDFTSGKVIEETPRGTSVRKMTDEERYDFNNLLERFG